MEFSMEELEAMRNASNTANNGVVANPDNSGDDANNGSLNNDGNVTDPVASTPDLGQTPPAANSTPPAVVDPILVEKPKSFEELLAERTKGKYKKWEEIEGELSAPKNEFANDNIRHWNELAKSGINLDREFFELQSLNLESLKEKTPKDILLQAMKLKEENKGLSDKTISYQIDKKYGLSAWADKEESELTDEDVANRELLMRDARMELNWLQDFKKKRTFIPEQDPGEAKRVADAKLAFQETWNKFVDDNLYEKVTGISVQIDPKANDSFEYKVSEVDRKEMSEIMKFLPEDVNAIFRPFLIKDAEGKPSIDHTKVYEMLLKNKIFDQAVLKARQDGEALGAKRELEKIKNTNFTPSDGSAPVKVHNSEQEALAEAIKQKGVYR